MSKALRTLPDREASFVSNTAMECSAQPEVADMRFSALLGKEDWQRLPDAVQARFSKSLQGTTSTTYKGVIVEARFHWVGRLLSQLARIVGGPLPLSADTGVPATVVVTEDASHQGQFWTRIYGRRNGRRNGGQHFPQVIQSSKRFQGSTGLEEYLGFGLGMALTVEADAQGIHFLSDHFFLQFVNTKFRLPQWLSPGRVKVSHIDQGEEGFSFELLLEHPLVGELVYQKGVFR